jgi:diaminohydroxyphosphoribosylaminopyrimidine deaminase/5-amino-6-(5-phosphoribosylamino)uracil reductase
MRFRACHHRDDGGVCGARDLRRPLEARGAEIEVAGDGALRAALGRLAAREIGSLLLEGGAALHAAAWEAGVVDAVRLYVTPRTLGMKGSRCCRGSSFRSPDLHERRVEPLGPDVLNRGICSRSR